MGLCVTLTLIDKNDESKYVSIVVCTWPNTRGEEKNDGFGFSPRWILIDDQKARWRWSSSDNADPAYLSLLMTRDTKSLTPVIQIFAQMIDPPAIMYSLKCEHQCHHSEQHWIKLFYCFFPHLITSDNCLPMRTSDRPLVFFVRLYASIIVHDERCSPEALEEAMCHTSPSCADRKIFPLASFDARSLLIGSEIR